MTKKALFPLLILIIFSMACNLSSFQTQTAPTINAVQLSTQILATDLPQPTIAVIIPTKEPTANQEVTEEPTIEPTEITPTVEPTQACPEYGVEEFDTSSPCWPSTLADMKSITALTNSPNEFAGINNGKLEFRHVVADEIYLYSFNSLNQYEEVILETTFVKIEPSSNQNGATLVCHVNDSGWYEVRIESGGTFGVFQYDALKKSKGENPYVIKGQGGTSALKVGANIENTIRWACGEENLTLFINGKEIWTEEFNDMISGGGVGLGLVSYSGKFPLHIAFERIEIIKP